MKTNKYALAAETAITIMQENEYVAPPEAWERATMRIFGNSSSQKKVCPKNAFLGLCEEGAIKGVKKGKYTKGSKNKNYALKAVEYVKNNRNLTVDKKLIWSYSTNNLNIKHNSQMDIVLFLYQKNLLNI